MQTNKTKPEPTSVEDFLNSIEDEKKRADSIELAALMQKITGVKPVMWGPSIVGFGQYHYTYASGREGDSIAVGFSPRKAALVLYGLIFYGRNLKNLPKLGKHTTGKGCLYIKDLSQVDREVLSEMIEVSFKRLNGQTLAS